MRHLEGGALLVAGDKFDGVDQLLGIWIIEQERKTLNGLVSQPPAAGFFPGQMFVKNLDGMASAGKFRSAHGTRRTPTDDCDFCHAYLADLRRRTRTARRR